ncbi:F0F1 ATP synthase subunit B [Patescibacteria group bacterium]|nr:F0F1 ATP synthase subunit B [Patescibacteria group bacterium]MBU1034199.1 F0F1 ATP synthase subunit B [Patescibacteria group bacterium]MBU1629674.1 F0F1 ATP synthase subunit B [Patescibacteria group bacterium]MBU1907910.1 F0F1 ATP synthase subunit B [Patescibacteria group bacterium]
MINETTQLAAEAANTAHSGGVLGTLGINWKLFIAQLINFAVVALVVWKWIYKPLLKLMDERTKKISDGLEFSKDATLQLEQIKAEKEVVMRQAKSDAIGLIEDAKRKAEDVKKEKLDQAKAEIEKLVEEGKERMENERRSSFDLLKRDAADLTASLAENLLSALDAKTRHELVKDSLQNIEKLKK